MQNKCTNGRIQKPGEPDMTPMVDVTFLLLIFFMVTASFQLQRAVVFPAQQDLVGQIAKEPQGERVKVHVDALGAFFVSTAQWHRDVVGKQALTSTLLEAADGAQASLVLAVHVDEEARLGSLVDVLDAGATVGLSDVRVTQVSHF